jgi:hypothetical protein
MIEAGNFPLDELRKIFQWNYELDRLEEAQECLQAIWKHNELNLEYVGFMRNILIYYLIRSLEVLSMPWIRYLLQQKCDIPPAAAMQLLHRSYTDGERLELFDLFVENGWNVNSTDEDGMPIFW